MHLETEKEARAEIRKRNGQRVLHAFIFLTEFVEVVLRHFHRCRYMSSITVVLLLEGLRSHEVLPMREYGGHENLRGSGRRSVIPYVHGRMELYSCVLVLD
jgi:hypothetical protein